MKASDHAKRIAEEAQRMHELLSPGLEYLKDTDVPSLPEMPRIPAAELAAYSLEAASSAVELIRSELENHQSQLQPDEELALSIVGGPSGLTFFPKTIDPVDPDKVVFTGSDQENRPFTLVQHVSQLNFAITTAKVAKEVEARRIGFHNPLEER